MDYDQCSPAVGDPAFAVLFEQYKNLVYKTAYLMLGDPAEAEDALQDVFWQVYRSRTTYDATKGAFTTWLHRITVNHCLNRKRGSQGMLWGVEPQWRHSTPSPEHLVEIDDTLRSMLQGLSEKHRVVVVLRYVWDLSYEEIAQILEIPLGTVQSRLHTALKAVRKRLTHRDLLQIWERGTR